ncbi:MAG TPA: hypothetical protein VGS19_29165 [Streptosporangiaceae bacterium]|nr:hypothetical protein [Streptosporangiaceae bacterium]
MTGAVSAAWLTAFTALAVAVAGLLAWSARWAVRILVRTTRFLDDYFGEPAREGVAARPGVMARLASMERDLAEVRAETKPNGGHSLRDVVHRTASDVAAVRTQMTRLAGRVEQIEREREKREKNGA